MKTQRPKSDPLPSADWNLHISAMVSPNIRAALVLLVQAAHADHEELENLKRAAALLGRKTKRPQEET